MPFAWHTPLCPAGHLPLKGGDRSVARPRPKQKPQIAGLTEITEAAETRLDKARSPRALPISPLEGEMSGRTEGGGATNSSAQDLPLHQPVKLRQQHDAFLFVRVGAGDHRRAGRIGNIRRQVRYAG